MFTSPLAASVYLFARSLAGSLAQWVRDLLASVMRGEVMGAVRRGVRDASAPVMWN